MPQSPRRPPIVRLVIAVEAGLIALAWILAWAFDRPLFDLIVFDWEGVVAGLLGTVPPYAAMVWSTRTTMPPFQQLRRDVERLVVPLFRGMSLWDLALIALLAGVGEEVFFRGLVQPGLTGWVGVWPAVILTSVLFGALHWITPTYAAIAGLIGFYLGAFMVVSGNLVVPILVHALFDFLALRYLVGRSRELPEGREEAGGENMVGPGSGEAAAPGPPDPT